MSQNSAKSSRPVIGFIACDVYEEVSRAIWQGAAERAREENCDLIFYAGGALVDPVEFRQQRTVLYDLVNRERIDGLVVASSSIGFSSSREQMQTFINRFGDLPLVSVEEVFPGIPSVLKDEYNGMVQAITHLIECHGRRRIVFFMGPDRASCVQERYRAYRDTLAAHHLPFDPNLVTPATNSWIYAEAVATFNAFLVNRALQPRFDFDAVAAINDESACAAIAVLKARGVRIPDDIAVVGFDDLAIAGSTAPPLTTLRPPFHAMGRSAVEILLGCLHGKKYSDPLILPAQLVVRHSCGCLLPTITEAVDTDPAGIAADQPALLPAPNFQGLAASLAGKRSAIVAEIAEAVGQTPLAYQGAGQLLNGFIGEIEHQTSGAFLSALDAVLDQVSLQGGRIKEWQRAISVMRGQIQPYLKSRAADYPTATRQADNLWHQARVMVGEAAWRHQSWKRLRTEDHARELRALGSRLSTAQDLDDLLDILAEELPRLGVPRCYLSLYVNPAIPTGSARLVMGYDENGLLDVLPEQRIYPACYLAPDIVWTNPQRLSLLVEPLYQRNEQLGFVVFETEGIEGGLDGMLWDALQMQISSSLKVVLLHHEAETARREAEMGWQLAEERRRAAEEADQLKSRFLSMVSHEMRTPLNVITGLSENLIQQHPPELNAIPDNHWCDLERIYSTAQHLDSLIRDVLDLAVSHIGQLKLVCEHLDISEVLAPVLVMGERMAAEKGLLWRTMIADNLPGISYDRTRLRQVVLNLISNAVKFTNQGEVVLCVQPLEKTVHFSVRDTGLGIPKSEQEIIFEEFHRSERANARGYGGLGLGLAICRRLVELGKGTIGVESTGEIGEGSTFYFAFPVVERITVESKKEPANPIVLLSDGEGSQVLAARLDRDGFEVIEILIDEQDDWLRKVCDIQPGAVILSFNPALVQCWEVVSTLKNNPTLRDVPMLLCSLSEDRGTVIELNYLEKPIARARILRVFEHYGLVHESQVPDILLVDDEPAVLEIHVRLVEQFLPGCITRQARNGREALEEMYRQKPDMVLLDLMMPEMNGFRVLEEMRKVEELRSIPVIVMTSLKLTEYEMQQLNHGVAAVLEKGLFSVEETCAQLYPALKRNKHVGSEARKIARLAMAYIHEHYQDPISRKDLAQYTNVSQEYLSSCFHREVGITPSVYLERYRLKQARRLLETTNYPITRVAIEVGFFDSSYFGRVFRREVGISPMAYRRGDRK